MIESALFVKGFSKLRQLIKFWFIIGAIKNEANLLDILAFNGCFLISRIKQKAPRADSEGCNKL